MPSHCNNYGFSAGFAAICSAISWYMVQNRECKVNVANLFSGNNFDPDHLQMFHYIAMIVGAVIFVLSFFDFAGVLYDVTLLFVAASIGIFSTGCMMCYASYMSFYMQCKSAFGGPVDTSVFGGARNVIEARDEIGITIFSLDIIAALLFISAAISFSRTY